MNSRPSLLLTPGIFPPDSGGPATFVPQLADVLHEYGFPLSIVTNGKAPEEFDERYPYPVRRISRRNSVVRRYWEQIRAIQNEARNVDLVFTNAFDFQTAVATKCTGKPLISKVVGDYAWERARRRENLEEYIEEFQENDHSWKIELYKKMRLFAAKECDLIITPSQFLKKIVTGWGIQEETVRVIYNAFNRPDEDLDIRSEEDRDKKIVGIGRLIPIKDFKTVIKAFARFNRDDYELEIIGEGPLEEELKHCAKQQGIIDQVVFAGRLPRYKVLQKLASSKIFVLSSIIEGLSHTLLEAMYCGAASIASNVGGNLEVIEHGKNGFLVEQGNTEEMVKKIEELAASPSLRKKLTKNARETVRMKFNHDRMMNEYVRVFRQATLKDPSVI